jgi:hypothetical protein
LERETLDTDTIYFVVGWWERDKLKRKGSPTNDKGESNLMGGFVD